MPQAINTSIADAVVRYSQRQTNQQIKRLTAKAERLNGDRHCGIPRAAENLNKILRELRKLDRDHALKFAHSIGVTIS